MPDPRSPGRIPSVVTVPIFPINLDGSCGCGNPACTNQGKHQDLYGHLYGRSLNGGYGILTGSAPDGSGIVVVDCDIKPEKGINGLVKFQELCRAYGDIGDTLVVSTGSGGYHFFFKHPGFPVATSTSRLAPGIDIKADTANGKRRGYVVGPGSMHKSGRPYQVIHDAPLAELPAWLLAWPGLGMAQSNAPEIRDGSLAPTPVDVNTPEGHRRVNAFIAECRGEIGTLRPSIQGQAGSVPLTHAVRRGVLYWCLPPEIAIEIIAQHYNPRCDPKWNVRGKDSIEYAVYRAINTCNEICPGPVPDDFGALLTRAAVTGLTPEAFEAQDTRPRREGEHADYCSCGGGAEHRYKYAVGESVKSGECATKTISEVVFLLTRHPDWLGVLRYDAFAERIRAVQPPIKLDAEDNYEGVTKRDLTALRTWLECAADTSIGEQALECVIEAAAKVHTTHPVRDYYLSLPMGNPSVFDHLAGEWFGADDPLSNELLKLFLVGAVRRIIYTGTTHAKMDNMLVLVGKGGWNKTKFIDTLWDRSWALHQIPNFDKGGGADISNAVARKAVYEFGELERIISRAGTDTIKDWLSREADEFRKAYGRDTVYKPRQAVGIGNTNEPEWLDDPRGSERRFWPITVTKEIPIDLVTAMRDEVWAAATALALDQSFKHWIPEGTPLDRALVARHGIHATQESWHSFVLEYVTGREFVTAEEVYHMAIALGDSQYRAKYTRKEQGAITKILKKIGASPHVDKGDSRKSIRGWKLPQEIQSAEKRNAMPKGGPSLSLVIGGK